MPTPVKQVLFWLIAQLPYAGAITLWLQNAKAHPVGAFAIWVLYQGAVVVLGFVAKVWGKLEPEVVAATADWVKGTAQRAVSRFRRVYNQQVIYDQRTFNVKGLRTQGTYNLRLEQVFVDLRIAPNHPQAFRVNPLMAQEVAGNRPIWDFLRQQIKQEGIALAIIGPPGCGKTTLLQHIALTFAANHQRRHNLPAYTPLLLFLRDIRATITSDTSPNLAELAETYFTEQRDYPKPPARWFERQLKRGKCIVLLDGLDEVADLDQRVRVSHWVDRQIKAYPHVPMVITARPQGYRSAPLEQAHVLEVQPFNATQVRTFVQNWYLANEIQSEGGQEDAGVRQKAARSANDLLNRLRGRPTLDELTRNPLLLTMIAMVHRYRGALPGRRVELYDEICAVLLGHWRAAKGMTDPLTGEQKRVVLQPLAAHMMRRRTRDIPTDEALKVLRPALKKVNIKNETDVREFLPELQASSGLFVEREVNTWSFAHLTFQEYLTAAHWLEQPIAPDWTTLVSDSWWHETLRLYGAQGDATALLSACLQVGTLQALTLAAEALDEARTVDPVVRDSVNERLLADLESPDPERRRLTAEVCLARRLKSLHRMDDEREIDGRYITYAEYQLFLDEMRAQGEYRQPDHWADVSFQLGQAQVSISGVRAEDAERFAGWLTLREGSGTIYRLPTVDEAQAFSGSERALATWCGAPSNYELVGLDPAIGQRVLKILQLRSPLPLPSALKIVFPYVHLRADTDVPLRKNTDNRDIEILPSPPINLLRTREHAHLLALALILSGARNFIRNIIRDLNDAYTLARDLSHAHAHERDLARVSTSANALARDHANTSTLNLVLAIANILNRVHDQVYNHAHDLDSTRNHACIHKHAIVSILTNASASANNLVSALDLTRERALALDHARSLDYDLDHNLALARDHERHLTHAIDLICALVLDQGSAVDVNTTLDYVSALANTLGLDEDIARALSFALTQVRNQALTRILINTDSDIHSEITQIDISSGVSIYQLPATWRYHCGPESRIELVLSDLFACAQADTIVAFRRAERQYLAHLTQYIWNGYEGVQPDSSIWSRRVPWRSRRNATNDGAEQQALLELHWWLHIILAREAGTLPAWEGIRIVRERKVVREVEP